MILASLERARKGGGKEGVEELEQYIAQRALRRALQQPDFTFSEE